MVEELPEEVKQAGLVNLVLKANMDIRTLSQVLNVKRKDMEDRSVFIFDAIFTGYQHDYHQFRLQVAINNRNKQTEVIDFYEVNSDHQPLNNFKQSTFQKSNILPPTNLPPTLLNSILQNYLYQFNSFQNIKVEQVSSSLLNYTQQSVQATLNDTNFTFLSLERAEQEIVIGKLYKLNLNFQANNQTNHSHLLQVNVYDRFDGKLQFISYNQLN